MASTLADIHWKSEVQPQVASTHVPSYSIIGATRRRPLPEDDPRLTSPIFWRKGRPSSSSSTPKKSNNINKQRRGGAPVTQENLAAISMAAAREEDMDAPFSSAPMPRPSSALRKRTPSELSTSSSGSTQDLPSITEETEEEHEGAEAREVPA